MRYSEQLRKEADFVMAHWERYAVQYFYALSMFHAATDLRGIEVHALVLSPEDVEMESVEAAGRHLKLLRELQGLNKGGSEFSQRLRNDFLERILAVNFDLHSHLVIDFRTSVNGGARSLAYMAGNAGITFNLSLVIPVGVSSLRLVERIGHDREGGAADEVTRHYLGKCSLAYDSVVSVFDKAVQGVALGEFFDVEEFLRDITEAAERELSF